NSRSRSKLHQTILPGCVTAWNSAKEVNPSASRIGDFSPATAQRRNERHDGDLSGRCLTLRRCAVARETFPNTSSACESDLVQSQLDQPLNLAGTVYISGHTFADGIVDINFRTETKRFALDCRKHLNDGSTMRARHTKNQLRFRRKLRCQTSCCMRCDRHTQRPQDFSRFVSERCTHFRRHACAQCPYIDKVE